MSTCVRNRLQELHLCRVKHLQVRHFFSKSLGKTFKYTFLSQALFSGRMGGEAGGDVNERANEIAQLLK